MSTPIRDQSDVAKILKKGSIPLVSISIGPELRISKITIKDLARGHGFVAISHVWAEGAGNVNYNALHYCILEDISQLVAKLPWDAGERDYALWIDTLCVPVKPPELHELALNKMRVPYERANHVLVLDSHLRSLDSTKLSPMEIFAQVSCSSWMRRLWTLQEGRLAKRVWFQFANEAVDVLSVYTTLNRSIRVPSRIDVWLTAELYTQLWTHIWYREKGSGKYSAVAFSIYSTGLVLSSRSVSIPTDEALCLFTLMKKDLTQVTSVPPAQRMEVFWRTFEKVPRGFVFSGASSKMSPKGLHWAPSSFMGSLSETNWNGPQELRSPKEADPHAVLTSEGLRVEFPGFTLHQEIIAQMKRPNFTWELNPFIQDEDGIWYNMVLKEPWREGSGVSSTSHDLAVILAHELPTASEPCDANTPLPRSAILQDFSVGILISLTKTEGDIMYVTAHNHVRVGLLGESTQGYLSKASICAQEVNIDLSILLSESNIASKDIFRPAAERLLADKDTLRLAIDHARSLGENVAYEDLLNDFLNVIVELASLSDCSKIKRLDSSQQWCVD
ncbi:MAG: hypothetical protein LQ338_001505 [Usnochroma carphineum]|nr:MAG: hypothetical protein LQ338_001505 [Usnochroma carphineum]